MPDNTAADLLKTIVPGSQQEFACPACGVPMSLRNPGSFELNLTVNARKEFNEIIMQYAAFLAHFEAELTARNIASSTRDDAAPYAHEECDDLPRAIFTRGIFTTKGAQNVREQWWERFDHYAFHRRIHEELPPITVLEAVVAGGQSGGPQSSQWANGPVGETPFETVIRVVLGGVEPLRMMGHIMSLVFDQPHIRRWLTAAALNQTSLATGPAAKSGIVADLSRQPGIAPTMSRYLELLETTLTTPAILSKSVGTDHADNAARLLGELRRIRLMLVLLLGHESERVPEAFPGLVERHVPFTLPRRVVVAPKLLPLLLESAAVRDLTGLRLSEDYLALLEGDGAGTPSQSPASGSGVAGAVAEFVNLLGEDTHKMVTFVCRGPSGRPTSTEPRGNANNTTADFSAAPPDFCGWYPKSEQTHPVVFIGSPGTSKSTLMLTGLLQFYNNAQALGATVGFQSDKDLRDYDDYVDRYWQGILPDPTPAGARNSIQLRVESTTEPSRGANFVFTDIPGEIASRSVRGEGADPIVLGVLKHAETLVFLFDLSIEQAVLQQLTHSPAAPKWDALIRNARDVMEARTTKPTSGPAKEERSRARVSQLDLLERMISDLREIRGADLQIGGPNIVCIIPKADLYTDAPAVNGRTDPERIKFLTDFYEWLIKDGIISQSARGANPSGQRTANVDTGIAAYRSTAGYGWSGAAASDGTVAELGQAVVRQQLELVRAISDRSRDALGHIGDALGHPKTADGSQPADARSLSDLIRSRLIDRLQSVFRAEDVYFLPISAQGSDVTVGTSPQNQQSQPAASTGQTGAPSTSAAARLNHPPNAKLSEYAFMLPIFLALRDAVDVA